MRDRRPHRPWPRALLVLLCLCSLLHCAYPGPVVEVTMSGESYDVTTIRVSATLANEPATTDHVMDASRPWKLLIGLPVGARGALVLDVAGLDADGVVRRSAKGRVDILDEKSYYAIGLDLVATDTGQEPMIDCHIIFRITLGDFNQDGQLDLAGSDGTNVAVRLGRGNGIFEKRRDVSSNPEGDGGDGPLAVAAGELNGDRIPDLAVLNKYDVVSVLAGRGDGTFLAPRYFPTDSAPFALQVHDLNLDGKADLLVTRAEVGSSVLLGRGDGTFLPPRSQRAGFSPAATAVGDLNGDGKPDLAVGNWAGNNVSVFLGSGDGSFLAPRTFATGIAPWSLAVGDFNADGRADLVIVNGDFYGANMGVSVLYGNGDGSFREPVRVSQRRAVQVAVGDFDGDRIDDLTFIDGYTTSVLFGARGGALRGPREYPVNGFTETLLVGDVNGDGRSDLVVANNDPECRTTGIDRSSLAVLLGQDGGSFLGPIYSLP